MRALLVGIVCLLGASAALAQATGDVEAIGFEHAYRPGCWTPMVVRLTPTSGSPFEGKIAVYQDDADHNHAIFTRPVSLRGNAEGGGGEKTQRFWMYFIPQADLLRDGGDPIAVNRRLLVYLTTNDGKQIARLPVRDTITEIDGNDQPRSSRLVLSVVGTSLPLFSPYGQGVLGMKEDLQPVPLPIGNIRALLPENVLGYEGVDSVIWTDADPGQLSSEQRAALEEFIKRGGKLVVCQTSKPNTWQMVSRDFAPLLPVEVTSIDKADDLTALKRIAEARQQNLSKRDLYPKWQDVGKGPYDYAVGKPKPTAVVDEYEGPDRTGRPFIVRWSYGMGTVTWVAQDLGDPNLTGKSAYGGLAGTEDYKWMWIWDRVMDWHDASTPKPLANGGVNDRFGGRADSYHVSRSFLAGMEFPGRGLAYLSLAFLFFIAYWLVAGPGSYLYLAGKKKTGNSWWAFAASAIVATTLTVLVVKLVLRGSAEVHHVTFVRQAPGEASWVHSQFGLYIPKDGGQRVELKKTEENSGSYVSAYPSLAISDEGPPPIEYEVPVFDAKAVTFPFRSTLYKLQANWVGDLPQGVDGHARLMTPESGKTIEGILTNNTGRNLRNVYVAFRTGGAGGRALDQLLYVASWDNGKPLDLNADFNSVKAFGSNGPGPVARNPLQDDPSLANLGWEQYWHSRLERDKSYEDFPDHPANFAMLSLFNRLPPFSALGTGLSSRYDLHRAELRKLDVSDSLAAGKLIVLAQTADPGPLPIPVAVDGDDVGGEGFVYYQFLLPLDRSVLDTQPAPATTQKAAGAQ